MTYRYLAYGLQLESDFALPGVLGGGVGEADVTIRLVERPDWLAGALALPSEPQHLTPGDSRTNEPMFTLDSLGHGCYFRLSYGDGTQFVVDAAGKRLWCCWKPPFTVEDVLTYLLGPLMGFLLRLRGIAALHACSVEIAGRAVALVGPAGSGKSATAAALALQGHPVLCEDVSPLIEVHGGFFVEPGYPRVCLWPDVVAKLFGSEDALPRLTPNWEKCYLPLDGGPARFLERRAPLGAIYLLDERSPQDSAPRLLPLSPREALLALVQNTYMNYLLDRQGRAGEFDVLARLVRQVPARRIVPSSDPRRLPQLCDLLIHDAAMLAPRDCSAASSLCV